MTSPGGVEDVARGIDGYFRALWRKLREPSHPAPRVTSRYPRPGTTGVPATWLPARTSPGPYGGGSANRIVFVLSNAVDEGSLSPQTARIVGPDGVDVPQLAGFPRPGPYGAAEGTHAVMLYPAVDLQPCSRYTVQVTTGVRDTAGAALAEPVQWSFRTGGAARAESTLGRMRAVDALMECLKAEEVEVIFGLPGGANLPTYDALYDAGIRHVLVRHEAGGGHAAEGYAKATGRVGVCFATSGPGATNVVTPIVDAMMDSCPVVFVTGQVRTDLLGTDGFQETDVIGITMPAVKHSFMIQHPLELPRAIHEAFHIAGTGRPGPVVVDIPTDLSRADIPYEPVSDVHLPGYQPTTEGNAKQIARRPRRWRPRGARSSTSAAASSTRGASAELRDLAEAGTSPSPARCWRWARSRGPTRSGWACSACTGRAPRTTRWTRPT